MTLALIIICIAIAVVLGLVIRNHWRVHLLMGISILAVFAFQPLLPVRGLDFWLPTTTLILAYLTWILTATPETRTWKNNGLAAGMLGGIVLSLGLTRYLNYFFTSDSFPPTSTSSNSRWGDNCCFVSVPAYAYFQTQ